MTVELSRVAAGCARAKGMVVCVRRLASEVSGAVAAVLVTTTLHGGGAAGKNDVIVAVCGGGRATETTLDE